MFQTSELRYARSRGLHRDVSCSNHMTFLQHTFCFKFSVNGNVATSLLFGSGLDSFNVNVGVSWRHRFIRKHASLFCNFRSRVGSLLLSVVLHRKFFVMSVFNAPLNFTPFVIQASLFILFYHLILLSSFEMGLVVELWQQVPRSDHVGRAASSSSLVNWLLYRRH